MIIADTPDGPVQMDPADLTDLQLVAFIRDPDCRAELQRRAAGIHGSVHPFHLPGKHNQKSHGHGGKGPTPGGAMHGATVDDDDVKAMAGGSAEPHLMKNEKGETVFTPERAALHQKILDETLAGHQPQENPRYHMLGGGPAAGKSTMEDKFPEIFENHATLNADDIKGKLPEYKAKGAAGAAFTHEESSWVAKRIQEEAFNRRLNVTLDGTGDNGPKSVRKKIAAARSAGYSVHGYYVTAPTDAAVARAASRGARTGRIVPEPVIRGTHRDVSRTFPEVLDDFDSAVLVDNSGANPIVALTKNGTTRIHDQDAYDAFLAKASE